MKIIDFLKYKTFCPKCNSRLKTRVSPKNQSVDYFFVKEKEEKITIVCKPKSFIASKNGVVRCSIYYDGDFVRLSNRMREYISLYGLSINIIRACLSCKMIQGIPMFFYIGNLKITEKTYDLYLAQEGFVQENEEDIYRFENDYILNTAVILKQNKSTLDSKIRYVNILPIDSFNFNYDYKPINKLNAMIMMS
jgi:hypothetical protein